jgi:acetyl-CoA acetyltransferase
MRAVTEGVPSLAPSEIEDVIVGCGSPEGCQGMNTAHIAATAAGFPKEVPATPVNRFCFSGSQAVMMAAHSIIDEAT